ncbi:hypothetical protein M436DRAFT_50408 [Aureobasidium namibiae CBS 147.97]|uniref:Uncharacterized protein n=1 Tax=Aureobasidium namibiae CBS 147.97 TaxID=1043004 RepID=A0A074WEW2_9PEZI|nr:uncharacterized protein M436DRAFT_50408 [Aureobasidium namibiae CBS 147.97]KEQ71563.1 hypothetical protein M436DRAFT_50408 [Aureobasidium namibiae CBS 147.97]
MSVSEFSWILEAFAGTLQVVELVDAVFWAMWDFTDFFPVLRYLRDNLHLHSLILDGLRVGWKHCDGTGEPVAKGRFWTGDQQIRAGLDVLLEFDGYGWDDDDSEVWREEHVRRAESRVRGMVYSEHEHSMSHEAFLEWKAEQQRHLDSDIMYYEEWKANKAKVKEAMDRVEAGEFST